MSQEESIRDILKSGRRNRRKNGLYKSHRRGHDKRAKTPKIELPWSNSVLLTSSNSTQANQETSQP